jgi:hypothetical protein
MGTIGPWITNNPYLFAFIFIPCFWSAACVITVLLGKLLDTIRIIIRGYPPKKIEIIQKPKPDNLILEN